MAVLARDVMELRRRSGGAGMMDCKRALEEAGGDIELAIKAMRQAGKAKADKKAGRIAAEGVVVVRTDVTTGVAAMVEINCETDFVARDEGFNRFAVTVAETALSSGVAEVEALSAVVMPASQQTIEELRQAAIATLGENICVRRVCLMQHEKGFVGTYVHSKRIGVLVKMTGGSEGLARDIAMHVAASTPVVVKREQVPQALIDKERDIFSAQAKESGKPEAIITKMIEGRINKYLDEVSLMGQPFIKTPDKRVASLLSEHQAEVVAFERMEVGEGIEKKDDNFVEEVMAQVKEG